jgi:hypothetical protein
MDLDEIKAEIKRLSPLARIATIGATGSPTSCPSARRGRATPCGS